MKVKKLVNTHTLADFFGMGTMDTNRHIKNGLRLDYIYIVLNREDLTIKQKRNYIKNTSMSLGMQENIWNRYQGDYGFLYCKQKSNTLDVLIQQEGGTILNVSL
jgi:hypothetical protein